MTIVSLKKVEMLRTEAVVSNARTWANKFESRWIQPGLISYCDINQGIALVRKETIDRCMNSMIGKPLVIRHNALGKTGERRGDPKPENLEDVAVGYISEVFYNATDGWYWCRGIVFDDRAKKLIDEGWKVSCCYRPSARATGGVLNGIAYDYENKDFFLEHLALEPKDAVRYNEASISIVRNSKPSGAAMFKIFQRKPAKADEIAAKQAAAKKAADEAAVANSTNEVVLEPDTEIQVDESGKKAPLGEVIAGYQASIVANAATSIDPESEVEYAPGKKEKMGVMCSHYANAMDEKEKEKNAAEEEKKKKDEEEATKNAAAEAAKKRQVVKLAHYDRLLHAADRSTTAEAPGKKISTESVEARRARGHARWSTPMGSGKN